LSLGRGVVLSYISSTRNTSPRNLHAMYCLRVRQWQQCFQYCMMIEIEIEVTSFVFVVLPCPLCALISIHILSFRHAETLHEPLQNALLMQKSPVFPPLSPHTSSKLACWTFNLDMQPESFDWTFVTVVLEDPCHMCIRRLSATP
jgi:hypothetical protein